jgi:hypothetical protein
VVADDVLSGYRLRVRTIQRTSVSEGCRVFGIHRSNVMSGSGGRNGSSPPGHPGLGRPRRARLPAGVAESARHPGEAAGRGVSART